MRIIGVTGPSGSGKTKLTEHFASLGIPTINADAVYHSMLTPPSECLDTIRSVFGDSVFLYNGCLDRKALSAIVFNNAKKLELLNKAVLGIVIKEIRKQISLLSRMGEEAVLVDAPSLIESGFNKECDTVISVISPKNVRINRISERDGIDIERATERVNAQKDDDFYVAVSDYVILNSGTAEEFLREIKKLEKVLFK